jgi:hypothetical protein
MDHPGDNVFSRPTFPLDQHRNVRPSQLGQPFAYCLHAFGASKRNRLGGHFPERLNERVHTAAGHGWFFDR